MNYQEYKKNIIQKNYKNINNYLLKREPKSYYTVYEVNVYVKYRQNKISLSSAQISNLYEGLFVDGEGIVNGTFIKKIEPKYILLSTFVLKEGTIKLSFKCELNSKQRWLDWDNKKWKEKIEQSNDKFYFQEFKRPDNYYLRVKNHYDATCKRKNYFVYKDPIVEIGNLECGDYVNGLPEEDTLYCNQYKNHLKPESEIYCGFYQNGETPSDPLFCGLYQNHTEVENTVDCEKYQNSEQSISVAGCEDSLLGS